MKKIWRALLALIATPLVLFFIVAVLIYLPPVQRFAVKKAGEMLAETMGIRVSVGSVRLAFPIDFALHNVVATDATDTLLNARALRLEVRMLPLLKGRADIDGVALYDTRLNTKSLISDVEIRGSVSELSAASHGVEWSKELVHLDHATVKGGNLWVMLGDTAAVDTTTSASRWNILLPKAQIERTALRLTLPGDTLRVAAYLGKTQLDDGHFDTGRAFYAFQRLEMRNSFLAMEMGKSDTPFFDWHTTLPPAQIADGEPRPPFDMANIALHDLHLQADTLSYDSLGTLRMGIRRVAFRERCGVELRGLSGAVYMDSALLHLPALRLTTSHSKIDADIEMPWRAIAEGKGGDLKLLLHAAIGHEDVLALGGGFVEQDYLRLYPHKTLSLNASVRGNIDRLVADTLSVSLPGVISLTASGRANLLTQSARNGNANFRLRTGDLSFIKGFLPEDSRNSICIPRNMSGDGSLAFRGEAYDARLRVVADSGSLRAKAYADLRSSTYDIAAAGKDFPLGSFLPSSGWGDFSGRIKASGAGFDFFSPATMLTAEAKVERLGFDKHDLGGISLDAQLRNGKAAANFASENPLLLGSGTIDATLADTMSVALRADLPVIDITALAALEDTLQLGTSVSIDAFANSAFTTYGAEGKIGDVRFLTPQKSIPAKDLDFAFGTSPDTTTARIAAGDLSLRLAAHGGVDSLLAEITDVATLLEKQLEEKTLDQNALKAVLPVMNFHLDVGKDNPLSNILRHGGYTYSSALLHLNTCPTLGLNGKARLGSLRSGSLLLDTIGMDIRQDTMGVVMEAEVKNYTKRNPNKFEAQLKAYLLSAGAGVEAIFYDGEGEKGVELGMRADIAPGGLNVRLYPEQPIIAYRGFKVNKNNFIFLGKDKSIRADVNLLADDGTGLKIYGEPIDSVNDITLSVHQLNLSELSSVIPYLPRLGGMLSGDFHLNDDHTSLSASASVRADGLDFDGVSLGNVGMEAIYLPKEGGEHYANAFISSNDVEVMAVNGTYFDRDGGIFSGEADLHDFPLQMLNGFLAGTDVELSGKAAGRLLVEGSLEKPVMNGELDLDSCYLGSQVYGFNFRLDERPVRIADSRMHFDRYSLYSTGKSPLVIDGVLDMSDFERIGLDFAVTAKDFELINTKKNPRSMVFGKVFTNFQGTLRGTADDLSVRGKLDILDRTDMTYILKDSPLSVDDRLSELVTFVSFEDSTLTEEQSTAPTNFDLTLGVSVSDAARFHCNLSEDGQNYVSLEGGGDLTLRLTQQGDMRLTGRFTVQSGEMKYALPVIPLKTFYLVNGSYVEFTGDMMNPTLNIAAKERVKAVVTENEQPRSVAFDVGVALSQPLESMGLEFTIEAPEDLSVQNQLVAMTDEQRGKVAVTMLATGMYLADGNMNTSGFSANNALNAFLQSEIQNIAGSALRTIDINLGVESGTSSVGTSTTDYSFSFAKRFWGNRISVIVGGKVSTGSDAENSAASIIDNISVEYRLDQSATRYVRVFYDRDTQDPLEGQLTRTGAGLVLRRKTDRLGELFLFRTKKK